jgi:hypothetical protein
MSAPTVFKSPPLDPKKLVGETIDVEGKGIGTVLAFDKTFSPLTDSLHRVKFASGGQQMILLQRMKLGSPNRGDLSLWFSVTTWCC